MSRDASPAAPPDIPTGGSQAARRPRLIAAALGRVIAWAERHRSPLLIAFGVLAGVAAAVYGARNTTDPFPLLTPRIQEIEEAIAALKRGAPPILAFHSGPGEAGFYKPLVDAAGQHFFYPIAGRVLGINSAPELVRVSFIACFAVASAVVPWLYGTLMRSVLAGIGTPLILGFLVFLGPIAIVLGDMYWIPGLLLVVGAPVLMLALTRWNWNRRAMLIVAGLLVVASLGDAVRAGVGLPVFVGALAVLFLRERNWRQRGIVGVCFVLAYLSISTGAMKVATEYRDAKVDGSAKFAVREHKEGGAGASVAWHQAYIGLAFLENDHGVDQFLDGEANAYVQRTAPGTTYLSKPYADVLRHRVIEIARDDPAFVIETVAAKAAVITSINLDRWRWLLALVPLMMLMGSLRQHLRRWFALLALMAGVGMLPVLLSWPTAHYAVPFAAAFVVAALIAAAWLARQAENGLVWLLDDVAEEDWGTSGGRTGTEKMLSRARHEFGTIDLLFRGVMLAAVVAIGFGAAALLNLVSAGAKDTAFYYTAVNYNVPDLPPPGEVVATWSFASGGPGTGPGPLTSRPARTETDSG